MRSVFLPVLLFVLVGATCSAPLNGDRRVAGSGEVETRSEKVRGVSRVSLAVPGSLTIEVGAEAPLEIEGDDNIVDQIEVTREGDHLTIERRDGVTIQPQAPLRFRIGVPSLAALDLAGSGRIETKGAVRGESFAASMAGSGTIRVAEVDVETVSVNVAGSGDVVLGGRTDRLDLHIAGSGDVELGDLAAETAAINIAGSGDANVSVASRIEASILGSGDVTYSGSPEVETSSMGSGSITRAAE